MRPKARRAATPVAVRPMPGPARPVGVARPTVGAGRPRRLVRQPHHVERVGGATSALGLGHALDLQSVTDVLRHRHVWEQRVLLKDGVDVAVTCGQRGHVDTAEFDRARGRLFEPRDHPQHGRLARTPTGQGSRTVRRRRPSDSRPQRRSHRQRPCGHRPTRSADRQRRQPDSRPAANGPYPRAWLIV